MDKEHFEYRLMEGGTAEITQYTGINKRLSVPEKIDGNTVTSIGASAFENYRRISVVLPDSVTAIGDAAFAGSEKLISVVIPKNLRSLGSAVFPALSREKWR